MFGKVCEPELLRSALERDDRQMSPTSMVADFEVELGSGATADESLRRGDTHNPWAAETIEAGPLTVRFCGPLHMVEKIDLGWSA